MSFFKASKIFLYISVFCVVIVTTSTLFPFIVGKYSFFRSTVFIALILFLFGYLIHPDVYESTYGERTKKLMHSPLFLAVTSFVFIFVIASFFAPDPQMAFWSNFERGEGGLQLIALYTFFTLLLILFKKENDWRFLFKLMLATGGLIFLYGVGAALGVNGLVGGFDASQRFQGSLGNPAYVGTYFMFLVFYALYVSNTEQKPALKKVFWILAIISFLVLLITQTRGATFGIAGALFVFLLYLIFHGSKKAKKRALIGIGVFLLLAACVLYIKTTPLVTKIPGSRLINFDLKIGSLQTRVWTWESGLKGVGERPFFGWGPENFSFVFDKYFDTRHYVPGISSETWYDRAHNVFFDYLVETGVLGLIAYLSMFVMFYYQFVKVGKKDALAQQGKQNQENNKSNLMERGLILALPVGYLIQGMVLFDILPTYINLFLFLAFAVYKFNPIQDNTKPQRFQK